MDARARADDASGPIDVVRQKNQLSHALARLLAVAANYPALDANEHARELREELAASETRFGSASRGYNDAAMRFSAAQWTFPSSLVASAFRFRTVELCDATEISERRALAVALSMKS
jgi:LemA protein